MVSSGLGEVYITPKTPRRDSQLLKEDKNDGTKNNKTT